MIEITGSVNQIKTDNPSTLNIPLSVVEYFNDGKTFRIKLDTTDGFQIPSITSLREDAKLTQAELSTLSGFPQSRISEWESGKVDCSFRVYEILRSICLKFIVFHKSM